MANQIQPNGHRLFSDPFALPPDLQDLGDDIFAAYNVRVGTAAERQNLPNERLREGLTWVETDTRVTRQWFTATGWIRLPFEQPWAALSPASGWSANTGAGAPRITRDGDTVIYQGGLFGGAANTTATTVPEWARPTRTIRVGGGFAADGTTPTGVRVFANGALQPFSILHAESSLMWSVR